jgi:hypothetical protein
MRMRRRVMIAMVTINGGGLPSRHDVEHTRLPDEVAAEWQAPRDAGPGMISDHPRPGWCRIAPAKIS